MIPGNTMPQPDFDSLDVGNIWRKIWSNLATIPGQDVLEKNAALEVAWCVAALAALHPEASRKADCVYDWGHSRHNRQVTGGTHYES